SWRKVERRIFLMITNRQISLLTEHIHRKQNGPSRSGPTAIELTHERNQSREIVSLSSLRGRRGPGRGGPSCSRLPLVVSSGRPLSALIPQFLSVVFLLAAHLAAAA